ncbi:MAG: hypothetical protein EXR99_09550 [Gemmataceae bacterium]|nr:hypothetical protein [Gemmataceae bacterium]
MKTILCFGDSNTWGYIPGTGQRHPLKKRWPGVAGNILGTDFHFIEEGLNGRTTVMEDPTRPGRNGLPYFGPCLTSHAPLDLVVLMLGTNDCKHRFNLSAFDISEGMAMLVGLAKASSSGPGGKPPLVLVVSPATIGLLSDKVDLFAGAEEKAQGLARHFAAVAQAHACGFFDASKVCQTSPVDGIHLDEAGQQALGRALAEKIRAMLG